MKKERKGSSVEARRICDEGEELMCEGGMYGTGVREEGGALREVG